MNLNKVLADFLKIIAVVGFVFGMCYPFFNIRDTLICTCLSLVFVMVLLYSEKLSSLFRLILSKRNIHGIISFYAQRKSLDDKWILFFTKKRKLPKNVTFMGQALSKTFEIQDQTEVFVEWCNRGVPIKILLLSPTSTDSIQLKRVSQGMLINEESLNIIPSDILKSKIEKTINNIQERVIKQIEVMDKKPHLRFSKIDLPFSMIAIDDEMYVTLYGTEAEADNQPTIKIFGRESESYKSFYKEFENIWTNYSTVTPHQDPILLNYSRDWEKYLRLKKSYHDHTKINMPPRQAIIFPTYKCSNHCSFCMYKDLRQSNDHIDIETLKGIILQLINYGVERIEISGGGEPLEYNYFNDLCAFLYEQHINKKLKFGLLTNGILLNKYMQIRTLSGNINLLDVFNDYIRISRINKYNSDETNANYRARENEWKANVGFLLDLKSKNLSNYHDVQIGIKYLLTNSNADDFYDIVKRDFDDNLLKDIDHSRFRSARDVSTEKIFMIEQKVYYLFCSQSLMYLNFRNKISLSLPNIHYPVNFRCWISPIHVVITPKSEIYSCCNFSVDRSNTFLGIINEKQKFKDIWESNRHIMVRNSLTSEICSCDEYCSNCRYAELQDMFERTISTLSIV